MLHASCFQLFSIFPTSSKYQRETKKQYFFGGRGPLDVRRNQARHKFWALLSYYIRCTVLGSGPSAEVRWVEVSSPHAKLPRWRCSPETREERAWPWAKAVWGQWARQRSVIPPVVPALPGNVEIASRQDLCLRPFPIGPKGEDRRAHSWAASREADHFRVSSEPQGHIVREVHVRSTSCGDS